MSLSKREQEDLHGMIDRAVYKFVGSSDADLAKSALNCILKGYDRRKTERKLGKYLEDRRVVKFTDKLYGVYEDFQSNQKQEKSRKRKDEKRFEENGGESKKAKKEAEPEVSVAAAPAPPAGDPEATASPGMLNAAKIREMMANAQKMISERKAQLNIIQQPAAPSIPPLMPAAPAQQQQQPQAALMADSVDKARKAADLQARIAAQLANAGIAQVPGLAGAGLGAGSVAGGATAAPGLAAAGQQPEGQGEEKGEQEGQGQGPTPLILDEHGRTIDAKTGEAVQLTTYRPTLKANIRAKRREQFKKELTEKPPEEITDSRYFDDRVQYKTAQRQRRGFKFHEQGKFQHMAAKLRTKAQLEKLQSEIASAAKKTGIASAAKLATIQAKKALTDDGVPEVEWWDSVLLPPSGYQCLEEGTPKFEGITHLVEHPTQMKPPTDQSESVTVPVMLTKKERKKLRRQTRMELQKESQEKIRLGLMAPPEPKVRLANLMRVLGTEAVQDPTKIEAHVRSQMAKRLKDHEERNAERKLSKEQRGEKRGRKLKEDTTSGVHVAVYRVKDLRSASKKFKVETNANQLFMTGIVTIYKQCNVVVVEGGPKQQKKFKRLMLHRIKWSEDAKPQDKFADEDDQEGEWVNKCTMVWEGQVKSRAFGDVKFKLCPTESFAREQFRKAGVEHYWDLAFSGQVMESAENNA